MERVSREITSEEEYTFLKKEAKELFDKESELPESHSVVRRALRCIKKLVTEVEPYKEYKNLEERGLLLRLPCPIGTTVYNTNWWDDVTEKVDIDGKTFYRIVHKHKVSKSTFSLVDIYNFGKTVFLTKAEAEQKLKEMESE